MSGGSNESPWSGGAGPDLLSRASSVLARQSTQMPPIPTGPSDATAASDASPNSAALGGLQDLAGRACPVTGASAPLTQPDKGDLRRQAHELVASLFSAFGSSTTPASMPFGTAPNYAAASAAGAVIRDLAGKICPVTGAAIPLGPVDKDRVRRQAHAFIETLLVTFNDATGEKGLPAQDQVPLIRCEAPVQPGGIARASLCVGNEESTPSEVSLYSTNFTSDSGAEIPAARVTISPRKATVAAGGEVTFEVKIATWQQTPSGTYSALIQATSCKYVKVVLSLDVL